MTRTAQSGCRLLLLLLALAIPPGLRATVPDVADSSVRQFLKQENEQHHYRATRRLEAENGGRNGWMEAVTDYSPPSGFRYQITAEGGSHFIRSRLRALLQGERDVIARGEIERSAFTPANYTFEPNGIDADGLANILLSPKRQERVLIDGTLFLRPDCGELVRLQGRLTKSPSFWVKDVDIVRRYGRIQGVVLPVAVESKAQLRLFGAATLRMTYAYSEVDGHPVGLAAATP
jgi:hypothetical protein